MEIEAVLELNLADRLCRFTWHGPVAPRLQEQLQLYLGKYFVTMEIVQVIHRVRPGVERDRQHKIEVRGKAFTLMVDERPYRSLYEMDALLSALAELEANGVCRVEPRPAPAVPGAG